MQSPIIAVNLASAGIHNRVRMLLTSANGKQLHVYINRQVLHILWSLVTWYHEPMLQALHPALWLRAARSVSMLHACKF